MFHYDKIGGYIGALKSTDPKNGLKSFVKWFKI